VRQRKEALWIVGWQNGEALHPFSSTVITECDKFHTAVLTNWIEETQKNNYRVSAVTFWSRWLRGLSRGFAGARLLGLRVQIPPAARLSVVSCR
jgi:hypothetical protein